MNSVTADKSEIRESLLSQIRWYFSHYDFDHYHYLDSAATTQKPDVVIDAVTQGYRHFCAPVHRASYAAGDAATIAYESARQTVADFIHGEASQLIFTPSCTASINQVALGWAEKRIKPNQVIWLSRMEHNANYLPWRQLCERTGARLKIIEMDEQGQLLLEQETLWSEQTFLIALTHCSNVLGGENPIQAVCERARRANIFTLIDAAQSVSHLPLDVQTLECDFLAFSAHKMYGPEGIGALYVHGDRLQELSPLLMGGGIVESVNETEMIMRPAPLCFEAGSPNLSGALGFAAAVEFMEMVGRDAICQHIGSLGKQFREVLAQQAGVSLLPCAGGQAATSVISFVVDGVHPHDFAHMAAEQGVAIRTGHHCSHLLLQHFGFNAVNRLSLGVYNSEADIEPLIRAIHLARQIFT